MDISIIIPFNKNRGYLEAAIKSVQNQRFNGEYEILPIQGIGNVSTNINRGVRIAKGEYIKLLGEDDMLTRDCLQTLWDIRTHHGIVCGDAVNWNDEGFCQVSKSYYTIFDNFKIKNTIHGGGVLYPKELLLKYKFDEWLNTGEEYDLHLRMFKDGCSFRHTSEVVYLYRIHMGQKSQQDLKERHRIINEIKARY